MNRDEYTHKRTSIVSVSGCMVTSIGQGTRSGGDEGGSINQSHTQLDTPTKCRCLSCVVYRGTSLKCTHILYTQLDTPIKYHPSSHAAYCGASLKYMNS